jgi:polyphosphate glucokinase
MSLGIDVGGSGIKGAPVDLATGRFAADRIRIGTPQPATPNAVCNAIKQIVDMFDDVTSTTPVGVTVPGVVAGGVVRTAANIDPAWVGFDVETHLRDLLGRAVVVVNDADGAGIGELRHGAAKGQTGLVVVTTLGTGIGTALIHDGVLIPNSELGHLEIGGRDAETWAASSVKEAEGLSFKAWSDRLQQYYAQLEALLWPDLIVVGGGISSKAAKFLPRLQLRTPIVAATLENAAGIIGAASLAADVADGSEPTVR